MASSNFTIRSQYHITNASVANLFRREALARMIQREFHVLLRICRVHSYFLTGSLYYIFLPVIGGSFDLWSYFQSIFGSLAYEYQPLLSIVLRPMDSRF